MAISNKTARQLISELREARAALQILRAVDVTVTAFVAALRASPPSQGMSDIIWQAEEELKND